LAEAIGEVVDDFRLLIGEQFPIVAVGRDEAWLVGSGAHGWLQKKNRTYGTYI
jgi:hypothetical protein